MLEKTRKFVVLAGLSPEHDMGVYNNNVNVIERAFVERYFLCEDANGYRPALEVDPRTYKTANFRGFQKLVMSHMRQLPRLSRQQVVDRYSGGKRVIYMNALLSLQRKSFEPRDARLNTFVKFEKQKVKTGAVPRIINPRSVRYNLLLGKYLKHAEKAYFVAINEAFGGKTATTVVKGVNAVAAAAVLREKWNSFAEPVALGLDASRFDMHVSLEALQYEHSFYRALFPGSEELKDLLALQLRNTGCAYAEDGKVEFSMRGTRASGDLNTSLGNCIIMCALVHVYAKSRGVQIELANNGDDCVVFMNAPDLSRFQRGLSEWFRRHGFAMVSELPAYEFEHVEFCQTRPVYLNGEWVMTRNHTAVLRKDPICLIPVQDDKTLKKWMHAVGTCGSIGAAGCPVQQAFYGNLLRNGTPCSERMIQHVHKHTSALQRIQGRKRLTTVTAVARVSYYYAFGLLPDEQVALESFYDSGTFEGLSTTPIEREALIVEPGVINLSL